MESAIARARAWSESNTAARYNARTRTGVESGSANTRTAAVSSGRAGSSDCENVMRSETESTGSTERTRGPTVSCANAQSRTVAVESTVAVTVSKSSRRSGRRLLF